MATSSRNTDSGVCRFSAEHLKALARQCEFGGSVTRLAAPLGSRIAACPPQYMPAYAQCFSEGNLRLPLSRFVCSIFEFYNLRFHQLGPLAVVRITSFEMQCRALGVTPAVGLFRHFFSLDSSRDTYSFLPRRKSKKHETPFCFLDCPSSSKLWRSNFFWLGENEFPVHFTQSLVEPRDRSQKDVPPRPAEFNASDAALLGSHRVYCRSYCSAALAYCRVSISYRPRDAQLAAYWATDNPIEGEPPVGPRKFSLFLINLSLVLLLLTCNCVQV
jgi:hypothetical protein